METDEARTFPPDILSLILDKVLTADLVSASQVSSAWRAAATDTSQLRCWAYDDDISDLVGTKASVTPMKPKTPLPKHWVNPTEFSPLAKFKTPSSLNSVQSPSPLAPLMQRTPGIFVNTDAGCSSPRTPSPIQRLDGGMPFSQIVRDGTERVGRFFGDVDISSFRLNDHNIQTILRNCPNLHTLRVQNTCTGKGNMRSRSVFSEASTSDENNDPGSLPIATCGCGQLTKKAFEKVSSLCPKLRSVTLVLQHILYSEDLGSMFAELGALPNLHTLKVELRMPSFVLSVKSEVMWLNHARCGDSEVYALIKAGPPPLQALGLNRCDLSDACISALRGAFPLLEAIDLHGPVFKNLGWYGISPSVGTTFKDLNNLTAAAFGIIFLVRGNEKKEKSGYYFQIRNHN
ncbi:hypothetical protein R1flu_023143 [Riccia fluitans]|uniref:F-box domain-containing protein n=1 Tax=Riccia fluitans TaxID=41844 RepID=A0ABD1XRA4_9MARC